MKTIRLRALAWPLLCMFVSASVLSVARLRLVPSFARLGEAEETTALPAPDQLKVFSLGYHAAVADYLFATTLVRAGRSFASKRIFVHLDRYLNAVVSLEPYYRDVYLYGDSLLTLNTVQSPPENYRQARDLLERGIEVFPNDAELWLSAGQYVLYLAIPWMSEKEDPREWRAAGAKIMQRACELSAAEPPPGCLSSLKKLGEAGQTEAAIQAIERMLTLTEDPKYRAALESRLAELVSEAKARTVGQRASALAREHLLDLPLASRAEYQIIGPAFDGAACLGAAPGAPGCATSFRDRGQKPSAR